MTFQLDPRLATDTLLLGEAPLCRWLLMNDARFPWCILVPRREDIREIHDLARADRVQLLEESVALGQAMLRVCAGDKLNVAALGNVVPQLHVHHVVRRRDDAAWPAPVWGCGTPRAYDAHAAGALCDAFRAALPRWVADAAGDARNSFA